MAFVKVAGVSEIPPDSMREVACNGDYYAICNVGGEMYALHGVCLHRGGPLGQGALHGHHVVCPWHAWEFDCRTGANEFNPVEKVATYAVKVEGDDVMIDIP